jgi:hypothetical protein
MDDVDVVPEASRRRRSSIIAIPQKDPNNPGHASTLKIKIPETDSSSDLSPGSLNHQDDQDHAEIPTAGRESRSNRTLLEARVIQECEQILHHELVKSVNGISENKEQDRITILQLEQQIYMLWGILESIGADNNIDVKALAAAAYRELPPLVPEKFRQLRLPRMPAHVMGHMSPTPLGSGVGDEPLKANPKQASSVSTSSPESRD